MRRRIATAAVVSALSLYVGARALAQNSADPPASIPEKIRALEATVAALVTTVTNLGSTVEGVENRTDNLEARIGEISPQAKAAPPCFDNTNRYVNCENGTVTDQVFGLIWLRDSTCLGPADYATANALAAALADGQCGLTDGSRPGDWRLPMLEEWQAMVVGGCVVPPLWNDAMTDCYRFIGGSSFLGLGAGNFNYWSSTTNRYTLANAFYVDPFGHMLEGPKRDALRVWPVRGTSREKTSSDY